MHSLGGIQQKYNKLGGQSQDKKLEEREKINEKHDITQKYCIDDAVRSY